ERPEELVETRWPLLDAPAQFLDGRKGPAALGPPGCPCLSIRAHDLPGPLAVLARRLALLNDIERRGLAAMLLNVGFHHSDILRRDRGWRIPARNFGGQESIIAQYALHRFLAWPGSHDPDGDTRGLHRRRQEGHLLNVIVFPLKAEWLAAPQACQDLQALIEQFGSLPAIGDLPDLAKASIFQC